MWRNWWPGGRPLNTVQAFPGSPGRSHVIQASRSRASGSSDISHTYIYIHKGCTAKPRLSPTSDKGWAIAGSLSLLDFESMIRDTGLVRSIGPLEALRLETRCVAPGSETSRSTRICALVQPYRRDSSGWKGKSNIQARSSQKEKGLKGTLWKNGSEMD